MKGTFVKSTRSVALIVMVSVAVGSPAFTEIFLTIRDSQVSLTSRDATMGESLVKSTEVGQTRSTEDSREFGVPTQPQCAAASTVSQEAVRRGNGGDARRTAVSPSGAASRRSNQN